MRMSHDLLVLVTLMGHKRSYLELCFLNMDMVVYILFACSLFLNIVDGLLRVGVANACYGQGPCSRHELSCGSNSRLAILSAVHGFKRKESLCPSLAVNHCSFNTKFCCKSETVFDCTFPFKDVYMRSLYEQCSGRRNCSYYTDRVQDVCSLSTRTLSSFSSIQFSCIRDEDILYFGREGSASGHTLYAMFDPDQFHHAPSPELYFSCSITSASTDKPVNVTINALDLRLDQTTKGPCSSLIIRQKGEQLMNITCGEHNERTFLSSVHRLDVVATPLEVILTVVERNMPGFAWIQMENDNDELSLSCGYLQKGWWDPDWSEESKALKAGDGGMIAAAVSGLIVIAILVLFLALVVWWKKRGRQIKYLQTVPVNSTRSKEEVERRLRANSRVSEGVVSFEQNSANPDRSVTLQIRLPGTNTKDHTVGSEPQDQSDVQGDKPREPIYDLIKFADGVPQGSAVGVYDHLHHVIVEQDRQHQDGYDKCALGLAKVDKDMSLSSYDTPESASKDSDDVKRNIAYDHLHGKNDPNNETIEETRRNGEGDGVLDEGYEPTMY